MLLNSVEIKILENRNPIYITNIGKIVLGETRAIFVKNMYPATSETTDIWAQYLGSMFIIKRISICMSLDGECFDSVYMYLMGHPDESTIFNIQEIEILFDGYKRPLFEKYGIKIVNI